MLFRSQESEDPIVADGGLPGADGFVGVSGLEQALLDRPQLFVRTLAEKLLTYGVGRGLQPEDGAAVREIVRRSAEQQYRFSALLQAIVESPPFRLRKATLNNQN